MTKGYVDIVVLAYEALARDATSAFPWLGTELERDLESLRKYVSCRGIGAVMVDLPRTGKHLDRCLDNGEYVPSGLPLTRQVSRTVVIPKLFRGLYLLIFDVNGRLKENADVTAILFLRQFCNLAKKVELPCPNSVTAKAIEQFLTVDCSLPEPSRLWQDARNCADLGAALHFGDLLAKTPAGVALLKDDPSLGTRLDRVFARISAELGQYKPSEWRFRHGPGAIAAVSGPTNKYKWYSWPDHLEFSFPISECGFHSYSAWATDVQQEMFSEMWHELCLDNATPVEGDNGTRNSECLSREGGLSESSRLCAELKTLDKPRLIGVEPNCHQWCQQNMLAFFTDRIAGCWIKNFIRFRDQTLNQTLCRAGSVTGLLATLDLSEASDRVTCDVVEAAFRSNWGVLRSLIACRTRSVRVNLTERKCEVTHRLNKFSTMGSAVTFPVESLIFLGIALATLGEGKPDEVSALAGTVSVFGDDIIVPSAARERLVQVLEALSFKVNTMKSFSGFNFRESCGVDAYRGTNVAPTYLRRLDLDKPESVVGMVETANHFQKKWMLNISAFLKRTVEERFKFPDIHCESGVTGFVSRVRPVGAPKFRWNKGLQRCEVLVAQPSARQTKTKPDDDSCLHQFFTEQPSPHDEWEAGFSERPRLKVKTGWVQIHDLYKGWIQ